MKATIVSPFNKLPLSFYRRSNVVKIAKELLGKIIVTTFDGITTTGRIVETEAYNGAGDKASHAYGNRRTNRTEVMFSEGGVAYVYLCYGIHHLFNVVTNVKDTPHAVLVRAVEPMIGIEQMLLRTGKRKLDSTLTKGPGNVSKALGIHTRHTGRSLTGDEMFIADDGYIVKPAAVAATMRIGVDYAAEDALLPYRFIVRDNPFVSGRKLKL
ncbi:MAG: DNA-3-methyladenine glycosylase [Chitinophagaceae bacterium]|jgi:DNA-3-methyladenine glycosylase|nr:DNA-3-methyladenine glycosylase [Chitinophagaceae bacterium]